VAVWFCLMASMSGTVSRVLRSGGWLGGFVQGLLLGDGDVFFVGRGGPGGGVVGVAVGGTSLQGGHVAEAIQGDRITVAVAGLKLGQMGNGIVVGLLLGLGLLARRGADALGGGGLSGGASVLGECRDAGTEGAILGDGGPGVAVRLDAGQAGGRLRGRCWRGRPGRRRRR
jgi:hypothetical protein